MVDVRELEFFGEDDTESLKLAAKMSTAGTVLILDDGEEIDFSWPADGARIYVRREPFACFVVRDR